MDAPGCQTSMTPATPTRVAAPRSLAPRCSRNRVAASAMVATSSKFNRSDAVAAEVRANPATRSAGPSAPPNTTATANGRHPAPPTPRRDAGG